MINENRVRHMTQMAMFDKHNQRQYQIVDQYSEKDFVSRSKAIAVLSATLFYILLVGALLLVIFGVLDIDMPTAFVYLIMLLIVIGYVFHLYIYVALAVKNARKKYTDAKDIHKQMRKNWKVLNSLYDLEEEEVAPSIWED